MAGDRRALQLMHQLPFESEEFASTVATIIFSFRAADHADAAAWLLQARHGCNGCNGL